MNGRKAIYFGVGLTIATLCCILMFYQSFLVFPEYDDEGHMMLKVRQLLEGYAIYDSVPDIYGPFFYMTSWLTYNTLGVPLSTDTARLVNMVYWLAAACLCAASVWRVTGRFSLTILTLVAVVLELRVFALGVSHPQAQACCFMGLMTLAATWLDRKRLTGPLIVYAAMAGALVFTKINLGVFALAALGFTVVVGTGQKGFWTVARWLTLLVAVALPWLLTRTHLSDRQNFIYATSMSLSVLLLYWSARMEAWDERLPNIPALCIAFLLAGLTACLFVFTHGTTPGGLFGMIIVKAASFGGSFFNGLKTGWPEVVACLTAPTVFFLLRQRISEGRERVAFPTFFSVLCKVMFGLIVLLGIIPARPGGLLDNMRGAAIGSIGSPFLGLAMVAPLTMAKGSRLTRLAVSSLALFEFLMVYPVAGAQKAIGSFLFIPVAAFCLSDALAWLEATHASSRFRGLVTRLELPLAVLGSILLLLFPILQFRKQYAERVPLDLPGTHWLRLEEDRVATHRWLAANINAHADTFLVNIGLISETVARLPGALYHSALALWSVLLVSLRA